MNTSPTWFLTRDEVMGFAKSRVMSVLWVALPILATVGYFLVPTAGQDGQAEMPLTHMMGLIISSLAGTIAAVMVAVDIVSEKNSNVYQLYVIRPIPPASILWAKFFAVFSCVTVACVISLSLGIAIDLVRGVDFPPDMLADTGMSLLSIAGVIAISTAVGIFFGVVSSSILVAVILILYLGQNLAIIPMLPTYLRLSEVWHWLILGITIFTTLLVMFFAGLLFRRSDF